MKRVLSLVSNGITSDESSRAVIAQAAGISQFKLDKMLQGINEGESKDIDLGAGLAVRVSWVEGGSSKPKKVRDPNAPKKERAKREPKQKKEKERPAGTKYIVERNMFEEQKEFEDINLALAFFDEGKDIDSINESTIYVQNPGAPVEEQDSWKRDAAAVEVA